MDVLKFLQQGNVSKNPEYNPKTKEGKTKSPLLVDYNVGENINDQLRKNITLILRSFLLHIFCISMYFHSMYLPFLQDDSPYSY